jgi:hypothetical protein
VASVPLLRLMGVLLEGILSVSFLDEFADLA